MSRVDDAARALKVGVFLVVALVITAGGIWVLGDAERLWSKKVLYRVNLRNVQGITEGSPVTLAGYRIGRVQVIELPEDITQGVIVCTLSVVAANSQYIREDTRARIKTEGLLGDKYIELSPGTPAAKELPAGAVIEAIQPPNFDNILAQGESMADNLVYLSASLRRIVDKIDQGKGLLGGMISDTPEGQKVMDDLKETLARIRSVSEKVDSGPGMFSSLLNDPRPARELRDAMASLARVTRSLEQGPGLLPRLLHDKDFADQVSTDLSQAAADVRELTRKLQEGKGTIGRLLNDEELAQDLLGNLRSASASLAAVTERVNSGEGSLGKLINDETLYEGVNDILAGARKSRLTRWFLSRSQKAGAKDRLAGEATPAVSPGAPPAPGAPTPAGSPVPAPVPESR